MVNLNITAVVKYRYIDYKQRAHNMALTLT